ncbi:MAG: ABC transporter ATP-binding protein [Variibacter sp.]|nr:ABC transporter ATP-binding protein [Variibacter sp.]
MLRVEDVRITFGGVTALDGVDFSVAPGEVFSIIGPNGAGKTTLFNVISGLYRAERGTIRLADEDVSRLTPHELARRGLSRTFQNLQVFFRMTVAENVMVGRHMAEHSSLLSDLLGLPIVTRQNRATRAAAIRLLERVYGLFPVLAEKRQLPAGGLSGGQQQMLAIGRALMAKPKLLLLDEPSLGLAPLLVDQILDTINRLRREGMTVLLVEQNASAALAIADRGYVLETGAIAHAGTGAALLGDPKVQAAYLGV